MRRWMAIVIADIRFLLCCPNRTLLDSRMSESSGRTLTSSAWSKCRGLVEAFNPLQDPNSCRPDQEFCTASLGTHIFFILATSAAFADNKETLLTLAAFFEVRLRSFGSTSSGRASLIEQPWTVEWEITGSGVITN
jgi:hypothetical protein